MSKVYLPTSDQMNVTLENLERIAGALGAKAEVESWAGIQRAVKSGNASRLFPIGTQFTVPHSVYGDMVYDVVAHDYFKSVYDENAHTMTLMAHDQILATQFDSLEAFYYAENELPAGTYNFTIESTYSSWVSGTYQFTLTKTLPKGGQLSMSGNADVAITARFVRAYSSGTTTTATEECAITAGNSGVSLGTFGVELNHTQRVSHGSNNYKESAIRQFLNSTSAAGGVWTPQTKFDRPPSWMGSLEGFAHGLDDEFLSCIGKVIVPCAANKTYESSNSTTVKNEAYTVTDKFYLASQREIFGTGSDTVDDGSVLFPYYKDATNADRIKYRDGSAAGWWTRSAYPWHSTSVQVVTSDGTLYNHGALHTTGCVPVCTIV